MANLTNATIKPTANILKGKFSVDVRGRIITKGFCAEGKIGGFSRLLDRVFNIQIDIQSILYI